MIRRVIDIGCMITAAWGRDVGSCHSARVVSHWSAVALNGEADCQVTAIEQLTLDGGGISFIEVFALGKPQFNRVAIDYFSLRDRHAGVTAKRYRRVSV